MTLSPTDSCTSFGEESTGRDVGSFAVCSHSSSSTSYITHGRGRRKNRAWCHVFTLDALCTPCLTLLCLHSSLTLRDFRLTETLTLLLPLFTHSSIPTPQVARYVCVLRQVG